MNTSPDVDAYIAAAPELRRQALDRIRRLCAEELDGFVEVMAYRMPGYARDDVVEFGFANHKQYISLYVVRTDVMTAHQDRLAGIDVGKGTVRYRNPQATDYDAVRSMLRQTAATRGSVC
jgi:uncharacterized protein YdhG (YjbR/CyaY superfamily)